MADGKKSFVLYADLIHTLEDMPDEVVGKLFKHVLAYVNDRNPIAEDLLLKGLFEPIKQQMKRDLVKWETTREKRVQAGLASAAARAEQAATQTNTPQQVLTHVESVEHKSTKSTVSVNATVNVNDTVIKEEKESIPPHPLIIWIQSNAPTIQKLKQPLTNDQAEKILADLEINTDAKKKALKDMMLSMENYVPLTKTSKSANLTIRKWWAKQNAVVNVGGQVTSKVKMNTETYNR